MLRQNWSHRSIPVIRGVETYIIYSWGKFAPIAASCVFDTSKIFEFRLSITVGAFYEPNTSLKWIGWLGRTLHMKKQPRRTLGT